MMLDLAARARANPAINLKDQPCLANARLASNLLRGGALNGKCLAEKCAEVVRFMSHIGRQDPSSLGVGDLVLSFAHLEDQTNAVARAGGGLLWPIEPLLSSEACVLEVTSINPELLSCRKLGQTLGYAEAEGKFASINNPAFRRGDLKNGPNDGEVPSVLAVNQGGDLHALVSTWVANLAATKSILVEGKGAVTSSDGELLACPGKPHSLAVAGWLKKTHFARRISNAERFNAISGDLLLEWDSHLWVKALLERRDAGRVDQQSVWDTLDLTGVVQTMVLWDDREVLARVSSGELTPDYKSGSLAHFAFISSSNGVGGIESLDAGTSLSDLTEIQVWLSNLEIFYTWLAGRHFRGVCNAARKLLAPRESNPLRHTSPVYLRERLEQALRSWTLTVRKDPLGSVPGVDFRVPSDVARLLGQRLAGSLESGRLEAFPHYRFQMECDGLPRITNVDFGGQASKKRRVAEAATPSLSGKGRFNISNSSNESSSSSSSSSCNSNCNSDTEPDRSRRRTITAEGNRPGGGSVNENTEISQESSEDEKRVSRKKPSSKPCMADLANKFGVFDAKGQLYTCALGDKCFFRHRASRQAAGTALELLRIVRLCGSKDNVLRTGLAKAIRAATDLPK
jgi:hypothetical protein